jgi:Spy/CpxP family protein refolding chaperone
MKKSILFGMICMFVVAGMSSLKAQQFHGKQRQNNRAECCNLSDEQKAKIKEVRIKYAKQNLNLQNQINELKAKQNTLISAENPNKTQVYANIDQITVLQKELSLQRLDMRIDMRSLLSDDQLLSINDQADQNRGKRQRNFEHSRFKGKKAMNGEKEMSRGKGNRNFLDLNEEQQNKMNELRLAHQSETKVLRDEAKEIRLKQKNLLSTPNTAKSSMLANVERLSEIQNSLAKKRFDHQMEVREILNEEQLVLFLSRKGNRKNFNKHFRMQ